MTDDETIVVTVEIAGAEPNELRVLVDERHLYIVGRRYDRDRSRRSSILMKEIEYGDFAKKIRLPDAVAYEAATASYGDGLLIIRLPVSEASALPSVRTELRMTVKRIPV